MQDDSKETANNMQADSHDAPDTPKPSDEPVILPGPQVLNWRKVVPNSITVLATMVGLSAVYLGMEGYFELAVLSILSAGVLDGLDGPAARALHGTSRFGAELDSLSDYVNFGVAPGILMYLWSLKQAGFLGWGISLVYIVCMGCRLARFNAGVDFNASPVTKSFFMGVPAPAGGALVVFPLVCSFQFGLSPYQFNSPSFTIPFTLFVAFLLVSQVPTFSSKMVNKSMLGPIGPVKIVGLGLVGAIVAGLFVMYTWIFLIGYCCLYMLSFPVSYFTFKRWTRREKQQ